MIKKIVLLSTLPILLASIANAQSATENATTSTTEVASPIAAKGKNIVSLAPIQFTENGVGLSFSYEKGIDNGGIVAYNLPVIVTFNLNTNSSNGNHQDAMAYFSPGIKFYPTSSYGTVKYAIGPSLVIGAGEKTSYSYDYNTYNTQSKFIFGIIVSNSLNINPTPHFYMGIDFGFGFTYFNRLGGNNDGITGIVQSGFKMGYRF